MKGPWLILTARGIGSDEVSSEPYVPRSRSREVTYQEDLTDWEEVRAEVTRIAGQVTADVLAEQRPAIRVVVKVRYKPFFTSHTRRAAGGAHQRSGRDRARRRARPGEVHRPAPGPAPRRTSRVRVRGHRARDLWPCPARRLMGP